MSPVHLVVVGEGAARVPVVDEPFWIGRDPGCDLCLWDLRISRKHACIGQARGEFVLTSEGKHGVFVNGAKVPLLALRHGDRIDLTPPDSPTPVTLRFENQLEGTFSPEKASRSAVWLERERAAHRSIQAASPVSSSSAGSSAWTTTSAIPDFEIVGPLDPGRDGVLRGRSLSSGVEAVLRLFPVVPDGTATDSWLRMLTALAGATHPALARVIDGGLIAVERGARRWMAVELVSGRPATVRIAEGPQSLVTTCRRARSLAAGLHLLHSRGLVHGGVRPSNLILRSDGSAVLVGMGRTYVRRDGAFGLSGANGEGVYVAPEALTKGVLPTAAADVYGLAALTQAMATGHPPFAGDGLSTPRGPRLKFALTAGPLPPALDDLLDRALNFDVDARPTAEDFGHVLAYVEATLTKAAP